MVDVALAGGPCAGNYPNVHAAPRTLYAVRGAGGQLAVLDEPDDRPTDDEQLHAYVVDERAGPMHVCGSYAHGQRRHFLVITYRYAGPVDKTTGELQPLPQAESERLADEYTRAIAAQFLLDTKPAISAETRRRFEQAAAVARTPPASPQGRLF